MYLVGIYIKHLFLYPYSHLGIKVESFHRHVLFFFHKLLYHINSLNHKIQQTISQRNIPTSPGKAGQVKSSVIVLLTGRVRPTPSKYTLRF